jgi:hypothetical protein
MPIASAQESDSRVEEPRSNLHVERRVSVAAQRMLCSEEALLFGTLTEFAVSPQ